MSKLKSKPLYLITDGGHLRRRGRLVSAVAEALDGAGGAVGTVQLREQVLGKKITGVNPASDGEIIDLALSLVPICRRYDALLVINSRPDIALQIGADGAHLGARSAPLAEVRKGEGAELLLGFSAHSIEDAVAAEQQGADYVLLAPIFPPISRRSDRQPLGLDVLRAACARVTIPVFALGGIAPDTIGSCRDAGCAGVAMLSSVLLAPDVRAAAREAARAWELG